MKKFAYLALALLFSVGIVSGAEATYPEKKPVFSYVTPEKWIAEVSKDGVLTIVAPGDEIAASFVEVNKTMTLAQFEELAAKMLEGGGITESAVVEKIKDQNEDGLTGYDGAFTGKLDGQPVLFLVICLKGEGEQSILGSIVVVNPATQTPDNMKAFDSLLKSLKGKNAAVVAPVEAAGHGHDHAPKK